MAQVHTNGKMLDDEILEDPEVQDAIKNEGKVHRTYDIINVDRSTLGRVAGVVAKQHGDSGFAGKISIDFNVSSPPFLSLSDTTSLSGISSSLSTIANNPPLVWSPLTSM